MLSQKKLGEGWGLGAVPMGLDPSAGHQRKGAKGTISRCRGIPHIMNP